MKKLKNNSETVVFSLTIPLSYFAVFGDREIQGAGKKGKI